MKRKFFFCITMLVMVMPVAMFAQSDPPPDPNWLELLGTFAASLAGFASAVVVLSEWLIGRIFKWEGAGAWVGSLLVSEALAFGGWLLKVGMFTTLELWWHTALAGVAVTLVANGIFSLEIVRSILEAIGIRLPAQKK